MKKIIIILLSLNILSILSLFFLAFALSVVEAEKNKLMPEKSEPTSAGLRHLDGYDPRGYSIGNQKNDWEPYDLGKKKQMAADFCFDLNQGFIDTVFFSRCFYKVSQNKDSIILYSDTCYRGGDRSHPDLWDEYCIKDPGKYSISISDFAKYAGISQDNLTLNDVESDDVQSDDVQSNDVESNDVKYVLSIISLIESWMRLNFIVFKVLFISLITVAISKICWENFKQDDTA